MIWNKQNSQQYLFTIEILTEMQKKRIISKPKKIQKNFPLSTSLLFPGATECIRNVSAYCATDKKQNDQLTI